MNHRKGVPSQQLGVVPPHKPPVAQPKTAVPSLAPPAPPIYWPQPASKAAQPKIVHAAQPRVPTAAPPVYRPQPAPQASQAKTAIGQARRAGAPQPPRAGASMPRPPAALPRPATLQAKPSGIIQAAFSAAGGLARNRVNAITGGANNSIPTAALRSRRGTRTARASASTRRSWPMSSPTPRTTIWGRPTGTRVLTAILNTRWRACRWTTSFPGLLIRR